MIVSIIYLVVSFILENVMATQLKSNGYVENYGTKGNAVTYGMVLTKQGRTELDKIASKVMKKN